MDDQDQFNTWCNQWEKAQAKWGKPDRSAPLHKFEPGCSFGGTGGYGDCPLPEQPARRPQQDQGGGSFYGMNRSEPPSETLQEGQDLSWREIYYRASKLWAEKDLPPDYQRVNEDVYPGTKNNGKYQGSGRQANPTLPWTGGPDASPSQKRPAHVTPNFTDGPELRELATLRDKLARLESTLAGVELGHKKGKRESIMNQIRSLHRQADDLSDRLCPPPLEDIA